MAGASVRNPHWVALPEDICIGANFHKLQRFCEDRNLSLSRHGHSVVWKSEWYQVFMLALDADAEVFCKEFGGERMHPSEIGGGKNWSRWKKGTYQGMLSPSLRPPINWSGFYIGAMETFVSFCNHVSGVDSLDAPSAAFISGVTH